MIKRYKPWFIVGGILLLLIITNPCVKSFKDYTGATSYYGIRRTVNLFVFSVYERSGFTYIGLFGNFIDITKSEIKSTAKEPADPFAAYGGHLIDSSVVDTVPRLPRGYKRIK